MVDAMNIHFHEFYMIGDNPLRYTNHTGFDCIIRRTYKRHPSVKDHEDDYDHSFAIRLQKLVETRINDFVWDYGVKDGEDIWVAICYWDIGWYGVGCGKGKAPKVIN